jgi:hypothetical protein
VLNNNPSLINGTSHVRVHRNSEEAHPNSNHNRPIDDDNVVMESGRR